MHKRARRPKSAGELNITSMMDMMTIILVFLLKSYSTSDISVTPSDELQLPISKAQKPPRVAVNLVISNREIVLDGVPILTLDDSSGETAIPAAQLRGRLIPALHEKLEDKASLATFQGAQFAGDVDFEGRILMQCDKRLPFAVIRDVMYTAGQARFGEFQFVVIRT